jgi:hypothetical protein
MTKLLEGKTRDHLRRWGRHRERRGSELRPRGGNRLPRGTHAGEAGMAALCRAPKPADVGEVATFLASDRAAGMTGRMANVTSGLVLS